jgi:hypothetical protein
MKCHRVLPYLFFTLTASLLAQSNPPLFAPAVTYPSGGSSAESVAVADVNRDGKLDLVVANDGTVGVLLGNGDGTFKPAVTYSVGQPGFDPGVGSVAVADVNGDGRPDLLVGYECADSSCFEGLVGVLLGNGDGTFQPVEAYDSGGFQADSIAVADVNGDGKPDLLMTNCCSATNTQYSCFGDGSVGVLLGNGDGTFQPVKTYDSGALQSVGLAVKDVNGDGSPDLLVANLCVSSSDCGTGSIAVLLNNGDGTFGPAVIYGSGGYETQFVAVADVNGDGKLDLLAVSPICLPFPLCESPRSPGTVGVLLGNGDGTFQPVKTYDPGGYSSDSVAVADVNGDGNLDLAVANFCVSRVACATGTVGVLLGNGDGTFQPVKTYDSGGNAFSVAAADVNGDRKPDLVVANTCANHNCNNSSVGVLFNMTASVQPPINLDGSSIFKANRGVLPVKFTLPPNDAQTCALPRASIAVTRTKGGVVGPIDESTYSTPADDGSNFRIDSSACQYVYNLAASSLGGGTYRINIVINGTVMGGAVFALK